MTEGTSTERRDWRWDEDGELDGLYVETRAVVVKSGPSAGREKVVFDFHIGLDDELVSVWETAVLKSKFAAELKARQASDFQPGERMKLTPAGMKASANGQYRDFDTWFEHAAPKRSAAELLAEPGTRDEPEDGGVDDDIPFS